MTFNYQDKSKFSEWTPFVSLLKREILRFTTIFPQTVLAPMVQVTLYLLIFGVSLGKQVTIFPDLSYIQFIVPGLILMGVINNTFVNSAFSLFMTRYLGYIVDLLVSPIRSSHFILAYTLASMLRGVIVGACILIISMFFTTLSWPHPVEAVSMILLSSFLFAQFGIIAAMNSNSFDQFNVYTNFVLTPLIYVGGLFYPISKLPPFWENVSLLNPLFYIIDGFRYTATGMSDVPFHQSFLITFCLAMTLFAGATYSIGQGKKLRT